MPSSLWSEACEKVWRADMRDIVGGMLIAMAGVVGPIEVLRAHVRPILRHNGPIVLHGVTHSLCCAHRVGVFLHNS